MLEEDIKYLDKVIGLKNTKELHENYFCWIYPFTNENISGYYRKINFEDKEVLTVTSSGDHALNALFRGAKSVETFDSNPLTKYYCELKCAAIKTLSHEEFLLFFNPKLTLFKKSKFYLDINLYFKIREELTGDFKKFWDYYYKQYSKINIKKTYLFSTDRLRLQTTIIVNDYLKEDNYYKLRDILKTKNITYHDTNITKLDKLNKEYDLIILSNIANYLNKIYGKDFLKSFKELIDRLNKNEKTKIVICYFYSNSINYYKDYYDIYNPLYVSEYFDNDKYEYLTFESADLYDIKYSYTHDKVLVSKQKSSL